MADDPRYPILFDPQYRRYYRACYDYDSQGWKFYDWLNWPPPEPNEAPLRPVEPSAAPFRSRSDSTLYPIAAASSTASGPAFPQPVRPREGKAVGGNYDADQPQLGLHYERLDPSFFVRDGNFFQEGRVFSILFTANAGERSVLPTGINHITDYNSALSAFEGVEDDEWVPTQVRRFIVVRRKEAHCFAVPIFTYSGKATTKHGVAPQEHAIAYSYGSKPELLAGEQKLSKSAICIVMNDGEKPLSRASRIYFGTHHPIQYNVKVKDLGYVHPRFMSSFLGYWYMEHVSDTQQAHEVTTQAVEDESNDEPDSEDDKLSYALPGSRMSKRHDSKYGPYENIDYGSTQVKGIARGGGEWEFPLPAGII